MTDAGPKICWADSSAPDSVADCLESRLNDGLEKTLAVPGGSTPFPIFDLLAARPMPWEKLTFWLTDDRLVSENHGASNVGRLRASLAKTGAIIHGLEAGEAVPPFDLVWLGMGEDGHVASLFPNTDPDMSAPRQVIRLIPDPLPPEAPFDRLSLTLPSLVNCGHMMLVVRGNKKRKILEAAISGNNDLPVARLLNNAISDVTIFWSET